MLTRQQPTNAATTRRNTVQYGRSGCSREESLNVLMPAGSAPSESERFTGRDSYSE